MTAPLEGFRVIELATGVAGPYAGKLLADFGAEVIKVEPPGGDDSRLDGPFRANEPNIEASGRFLFLNTRKQSIVLDLEDADDRTTFERLVTGADAVIEDRAPGALDALGLGYDHLDDLSPGIVLASVTPWGQSGPYLEAGYELTDLVAQAMGGPMLWTGSAEREPLRLGGGPIALYQAGGVTLLATMMALFRQEATGEGDHIDVSIYETQIGSRDRAGPYVANYIYNGTEPKRRASGGMVASGMRPTPDGFVNILGTGPRLPAFLTMIGLDELAADPDAVDRVRDVEVAEMVEATYLTWLSQRTKLEAAEAAQASRLLAGPVNRLSDLVTDPHFRDRGFWDRLDHPVAGTLEYPGRPLIFGDSPRAEAQRAPLLDEHRSEVLAAAESSTPRRTREPRQGWSPFPGRPPLEGVRVADITVVWAGPYATQLLAEWGAEVIRVEPTSRIQPSTRGADRRTTRELEMERGALGIAAGGSYPDYEPGVDPWNRNAGFNSHARNKRSMACDITTPEGREHFLRLIEQCDVLIENNVPETIAKAHITYEELAAVNPRLIMVRMPAYGLSGPYSSWRALGTHVEGLVGHHHLRGYPGETPDAGGDVFTADACAGAHGAFAAVAALRHRRRSGRGQLVELPLAEGFLPYLGEHLLDYQMNGRDEQWGNRHRAHAPHQAYPTAGDDAWIAIEVRSDEEFARACEVLGCPQLASDDRFASAASRKAHEAELDVLIGERTRTVDKWELFRRLQAAGVPAGPLQTAAERFACPQLEARGFFEELDSPSVGRMPYPGLIWRMAKTPNQLRRGPVRLGQDNEYVYRDLLGLSAEALADLEARGLVGTTYPGLR